jgi:hypothetical protein
VARIRLGRCDQSLEDRVVQQWIHLGRSAALGVNQRMIPVHGERLAARVTARAVLARLV